MRQMLQEKHATRQLLKGKYVQQYKCTTCKMSRMDHIMDGLGSNCMSYVFGPQSFSIIIIHLTKI
jgi:hypothetical protein